MSFDGNRFSQANIDVEIKKLLSDLLDHVNSAQALGDDVTASAAELNLLDGSIAGTSVASKALVIGSSKNTDTLLVNLFGFGSGGVEDTITAHAGGTQAAAFALSATKSVHNVVTVGTAADSVVLPAATGSGKMHWVKNSAAANSLQLFGADTETIDGVASATGVAVAAGKSRLVVDIAAGKWVSALGA